MTPNLHPETNPMTDIKRLRELLEIAIEDYETSVGVFKDPRHWTHQARIELDRLRSPVSKEALAAVEAGAAETLAAIQRAKEDQEYESLDRFQGRIAEREAIVAWLTEASRFYEGDQMLVNVFAKALTHAADAISSGAHIKGGQEG